MTVSESLTFNIFYCIMFDIRVTSIDWEIMKILRTYRQREMFVYSVTFLSVQAFIFVMWKLAPHVFDMEGSWSRISSPLDALALFAAFVFNFELLALCLVALFAIVYWTPKLFDAVSDWINRGERNS
jgi:hypothetical protein